MRLSRNRDILNYISNHGVRDRNTIAIHLNLTLSGSKRIVDDLCENGYLQLIAQKTLKKGRPSELVDFNPKYGLLGVMELGRINNKCALFDFQGNLIEQAVFPSDFTVSPEFVLVKLTGILEKWCAGNKIKKRSMAIAASGVVDYSKGDIHHLHPEKGWNHFNPAYILKGSSDPLCLVSYADAAMAAETVRGVLKDFDGNAIFLHLGSIVSAAVMLSGKPFRGNGLPIGQIGHTKIPDNNMICYCGKNGCAEALVSTESLIKKCSVCVGDSMSESALEQLVKKAINGSDDIMKVFEDCAVTAGHILAVTINLLAPEKVILGGQLFFEDNNLTERLIDIIRKTILSESFNICAEAVQLSPSALGNDSIITGAAILARNAWIADSSMRSV